MPQLSNQQILKRTRLTAAVASGRQGNRTPDMAITQVSAMAIEEPVSKRSSVILKVATDAGVTGIGELSVGRHVTGTLGAVQVLSIALRGKDALGRELLLWELRRSSGDASGAFLAGLEMALLDIAGKTSEAPAYQVLSGQTRTKARALARLTGNTEQAFVRSLDRAKQMGHRAFLIPLQLPENGIRGRRFYRETKKLLEDLRNKAGDGCDFAIDCQGQLRPSQAADLAREMEDFRLLWLDEPCSETSEMARRRIADESVTPIGLGRYADEMDSFRDWLRVGSADVVRPDVRRIGVSSCRKIATHAETHYVAMAPAVSGSALSTAAGIHLAASIPNFFILEVPVAEEAKDRQMRKEILNEPIEMVEDGFLTLPVSPGLGVTLNEEALRRYAIAS